MSRKFFDFLRKFEGTLSGMSANTYMEQREEWMGPPERDRQRCAEALENLASVWDQPPQDLETLKQMTARCIDLYALGENDAGHFAVKDIDEFLSGVRDRAVEAKLK
jgi:hypothetical protein